MDTLDADPRSVEFAKASVDAFVDAARAASIAKDELLVTLFLGLAFEIGCTLYGFDVWIAQMEREFPADWGLRFPRGYH